MHLRVIVTLFVLALSVSSATAQTPFYQGKTITIIVSTKAGDVYDLYPRLVAEFMPKHIPGNPNFIIQNVPGAAGLIGTNQIYNVAKPDGLTFGATYPALYFEQLVKRPEVKFDWTKFIWIGSTINSNSLMYMRADTPYKTVEDVRTEVVGNPNFDTEVFDSDGNPAGLPRMLNRGDFLGALGA